MAGVVVSTSLPVEVRDALVERAWRERRSLSSLLAKIILDEVESEPWNGVDLSDSEGEL